MNWFLILGLTFIVSLKQARAETAPLKTQTSQAAPTDITPLATEPSSPTIDDSQARRSLAHRLETRWSFLAQYSLLDLWVPSKWGVAASYQQDSTFTYEFDYLRGSLSYGAFGLDLAGVTETRYSLLRRSYGARNSFNYILGVFYDEFKAHLGSKYLASLSNSERGYATLIESSALGASVGIGQRWQAHNGLTWSVDWITLHIPILIVRNELPFLAASSDPQKAQEVRNGVAEFRRFPALSVLKIQGGFSW